MRGREAKLLDDFHVLASEAPHLFGAQEPYEEPDRPDIELPDVRVFLHLNAGEMSTARRSARRSSTHHSRGKSSRPARKDSPVLVLGSENRGAPVAWKGISAFKSRPPSFVSPRRRNASSNVSDRRDSAGGGAGTSPSARAHRGGVQSESSCRPRRFPTPHRTGVRIPARPCWRWENAQADEFRSGEVSHPTLKEVLTKVSADVTRSDERSGAS